MRARNKKSSRVLLVGAGVVAAILVVLFVFSGAAGRVFPAGGSSRYAPFPETDFLANPASYAGNNYRIEGTVDNVLQTEELPEGIARLVSLGLANGKFVPVFVPPKIAEFAIQRSQQVVADCTISVSGLPVARNLEKK